LLTPENVRNVVAGRTIRTLTPPGAVNVQVAESGRIA
jgi:hypothetical protein